MATMRKEIFTVIYFALGIIFIASEYLEFETIRFLTKPLLMPALIVSYLSLNKKYGLKHNWLMILALIFSWLGDTFLLLQKFTLNFFLIGLACFLLTHVFYIILFFKPRILKPFSMFKAVFIFIILSYLVIFIYLLRPYLNDVYIPIVLHAIILIIMLLTALDLQGKVEKEAFQFIFSGAFLFVIAESLIAIDKFYVPFSLATFSIMTFYLLAQYFVMKGIIIRDQNNKISN